MNSRLLAMLFATSFAAGCGSAQSTRSADLVTSPFTEEHAAVFEDGIDLVRDPRILEGQWLEQWEDELDRRIGLADVVALVTVQTLRTDLDLERRQTYRLVTHVDRVYLGTNVGDELALVVREGEGGYGTVQTNERQILDSQFIAFVKWARDEADGTVRPRWHLSPATEPVAGRVRARLERERRVDVDESGRRRVIIHRD